MAAARSAFEEVAAGAVTRGDINVTVSIDRGRNNSGGAVTPRAPEDAAILSGQSREAAFCELDILTNAGDFGENGRRVVDRVGQFFALPNQRAGLFIEGDEVASISAGCQNDFFAIEQ